MRNIVSKLLFLMLISLKTYGNEPLSLLNDCSPNNIQLDMQKQGNVRITTYKCDDVKYKYLSDPYKDIENLIIYHKNKKVKSIYLEKAEIDNANFKLIHGILEKLIQIYEKSDDFKSTEL